MVASQKQLPFLRVDQQKRVYSSFEHTRQSANLAQITDVERLAQIDSSRGTVQQYVSTGFTKSLQLQEAMLEYLRIREHEETLHLPATPVPDLLLPYFLNISHAGLQAVIKQLGFYRSSSVPSTALTTTSQKTQGTSVEDLIDEEDWIDEEDEEFFDEEDLLDDEEENLPAIQEQVILSGSAVVC